MAVRSLSSQFALGLLTLALNACVDPHEPRRERPIEARMISLQEAITEAEDLLLETAAVDVESAEPSVLRTTAERLSRARSRFSEVLRRNDLERTERDAVERYALEVRVRQIDLEILSLISRLDSPGSRQTRP